jgi:hypothetical protein
MRAIYWQKWEILFVVCNVCIGLHPVVTEVTELRLVGGVRPTWTIMSANINKLDTLDTNVPTFPLHISIFTRSSSGDFISIRFLFLFFQFWFVRLLALRPLLAYCASLRW